MVEISGISQWLETHGTWEVPEHQAGEVQLVNLTSPPGDLSILRWRRSVTTHSQCGCTTVSGAWLTWLTSEKKELDLWTRGEQWMLLPLNSAISHVYFPVLHVSSPVWEVSLCVLAVHRASRFSTSQPLPEACF